MLGSRIARRHRHVPAASRQTQPIETRNYLRRRRIRGRRKPDETLVACVEEARKDALEMAQEADAPSQARAEDASTLTGPRVLPNAENRRLAFHGPRRRWDFALTAESVIG